MRLRYSIPPDGQVLRAQHLHDQTMFSLTEAGRALRGVWGFFRAPDLSVEHAANEIFVEREVLVIRNLALLSPDGVVLRVGDLREPVPGDGGTARVVWGLPANNTENEGRVSVRLEFEAERRRPPDGSVTVVIGKVEDNRFVSEVPVLSLEGSASVADAWAAVCKALGEFELLIGSSGHGDTFHRRLVESELRGIGRLQADTVPQHAVTCVETAVERLAAFAEAHGADKRVLREIERARKEAAKCRETAGGLTALEHALNRLAEMASAELKGAREWLLHTEAEWVELPADGEIRNPEHTMTDYGVEGARVGRIRIRFEKKASRPNWRRWPEVSYRFDEGAFLVLKHVQEEKMRDNSRTIWTSGDLEIPDGAERLRVRCERDVDVRVEAGAGPRSARRR